MKQRNDMRINVHIIFHFVSNSNMKHLLCVFFLFILSLLCCVVILLCKASTNMLFRPFIYGFDLSTIFFLSLLLLLFFFYREYPCDHYTSVINVTLLMTGCPRVDVHSIAVQLLQVLDKRFFGNVGPLQSEGERGEQQISIVHSI